ASIGSFTLGDASVTVDPSSLALSANLKLGSVFTARLEGSVFYGSVSGKTIKGPDGKRAPASAGDFLLSATDVSIDLGGFKANGTVELGRAQGTPWANLATTLQLLGTGSGNSIAVNGSFSGSGDLSFSGSGNLTLAGVSANTSVAVAKTGTKLTVHGDAKLTVLGSQIAFSGDFAYDKGSPRFRLLGSGNLRLGTYNVAGASFSLSNFPQDAGMSASVTIDAGSIAHASGRLSIVGGLFYFGANTSLDLKILRADGSVTLTNCALSQPTNPNPYPQIFQYPNKALGVFGSFTPSPEYLAAVAKWWSESTPGKCVSSLGGTRLVAAAGFSFGGFSFAVSAKVEPNGDFSATARSPSEGEWHGETPATYLIVVAFYADLNYQMEITVKNTSPYIDLYGKGSANIYGKRWAGKWLDWSKLVGVAASIRTNPFEACAYVNVWGKDFGGCIR
ncbi:MAG TPA: hypothetical protein VN770_07125, partial [Gaiellaceae bacterium]|nr:hypothetical protein [Gaiellaceae bacterium]